MNAIVEKIPEQTVLSISANTAYLNEEATLSTIFQKDLGRSDIFFIDKGKPNNSTKPLTNDSTQQLLREYPELSILSLIVNQNLPLSFLDKLRTPQDVDSHGGFTISNQTSDENQGRPFYSITKQQNGNYTIESTTLLNLKRTKVSLEHIDDPQNWSFKLSIQVELPKTVIEEWKERKQEWVGPLDKADQRTNVFLKENNVTCAVKVSDIKLIMNDDTWEGPSKIG